MYSPIPHTHYAAGLAKSTSNILFCSSSDYIITYYNIIRNTVLQNLPEWVTRPLQCSETYQTNCSDSHSLHSTHMIYTSKSKTKSGLKVHALKRQALRPTPPLTLESGVHLKLSSVLFLTLPHHMLINAYTDTTTHKKIRPVCGFNAIWFCSLIFICTFFKIYIHSIAVEMQIYYHNVPGLGVRLKI